MINISIPVERHVQKFLAKRYGTIHTATKTTFLGMEVLQALTEEYERPYLPSERKRAYCTNYQIFIPERYFNSHGHSISVNNLKHLGIAMSKYFVESMCTHLDMMVGQNRKAYAELKLFLAHHNITEEDAKLETLYKVYQRHCQGPIKTKKIAV